MLVDLFSRVEYYFKRLEIHTSVPTTAAMRGIMMDIMVEIFSFLAIVTKELRQGRKRELVLVIIAVLNRHIFRGIFQEADGKYGRRRCSPAFG